MLNSWLLGKEGSLIYSVWPFLWYKYPHYGLFQTIIWSNWACKIPEINNQLSGSRELVGANLSTSVCHDLLIMLFRSESAGEAVGLKSPRIFQYVCLHLHPYKKLIPLFRFHLTPPSPSLPLFGRVPRMITVVSLLGDTPYCDFLPCVCKPRYVPGTKIMNKCLFSFLFF